MGAIGCNLEPAAEQIVVVLVGGRGNYVRDWKIVRLYAFDKFKLGAVRRKFVLGIRDHEQAQIEVVASWHSHGRSDRKIGDRVSRQSGARCRAHERKESVAGCDHGAANVASQLHEPGNGMPTAGLAYEVEPLETILPLKGIESGTGNTDFQ